MRGQQDHSAGRLPLCRGKMWRKGLLEEESDILGSGEPAGVEGWGWARTLSSMW